MDKTSMREQAGHEAVANYPKQQYVTKFEQPPPSYSPVENQQNGNTFPPPDAMNIPPMATQYCMDGDQVMTGLVRQEALGIHHRQASNYHNLALFVCLCCCWPLGRLAINESRKVDEANARGQVELARKHSQKAKSYSIVGLILGTILCIVLVVFFYFRILAAARNR